MNALVKLAALMACCCASSAADADVKLPAIFSDHMVLQADKPTAVWGWADPGERVTVGLGESQAVAQANVSGKWSVRLPPLQAGGPLTLHVTGRNSLAVNDVLVGEVWLCSGQSNMAMQVKGLHGQVDRADEEIAAANHPQIRMFAYDQIYSIYELTAPPSQPMTDRPGKWFVCSPETVAQFTACGYFFALDVQQELKVPVGLINAAVGGTPVEAWTSLAAQQALPELKPVLDDWKRRLDGYDPATEQKNAAEAKAEWAKQKTEAAKKGEPAPKAPAAAVFKNLAVSNPGGLFNGMIAPVIPYTVRGVLWYQGERNAAGPLTKLYAKQFVAMVHDWRKRWADDSLYFAYVQLPRFQKEQTKPSESNGWGVWVRDGQRVALPSIEPAGMAITLDYGGADGKYGHPTNKRDFARRLSLLALHDVYGKPIPVWSGPIYKSATRDGNRMVITFDHGKGLKAAGDELKGFAIAGADKKFVWADAKIDGDKVIVWSDEVKEPAGVRYAWAANTIGNLRNAGDIPASTFRTDDWPD